MRLLLVRLEKAMVAPVSSFAAKDGSSTSGQRRHGFCIMPRAVSVTSSIWWKLYAFYMRFRTISDYRSTDEQLKMLKLQSCTP